MRLEGQINKLIKQAKVLWKGNYKNKKKNLNQKTKKQQEEKLKVLMEIFLRKAYLRKRKYSKDIGTRSNSTNKDVPFQNNTIKFYQ